MSAPAALPAEVRRLPLDDLSPLAELIGEARVVAIGENNHHIREFGLLRARILRFLVTELGFGVLGFESGFTEGRLVDNWVRGGPGELTEVAKAGFTFRFGEAVEVQDLLRWLREHNLAGGRVRFAGLDIPGSGGSGLPALHRVRDYLAAHFPGEERFADEAIAVTEPYVAANNGAAPARYATLSEEQRNAATTALARLLLRLDGLRPGPDPEQHVIMRHHALGALRLDEQLRELVRLGQPDLPSRVVSSRDCYQAETVRLLRELYGPEERIVLLMHNGHAQRVPLSLLPEVWAPSAGNYLAADLGDDYVAIGVTALDGITTGLALDDQAEQGIDVFARPLDQTQDGSVEQAIMRDGLGDRPVLLDLRPARGAAGPTSIRHAWTHAPVDVLSAFDALACLPSMTTSSFVRTN